MLGLGFPSPARNPSISFQRGSGAQHAPCSSWHRQRSPVAAADAGERTTLFCPVIPSLILSFQGLRHFQMVVTPPQTAAPQLPPPAHSSAGVFINGDLPPRRVQNHCPRFCQVSETRSEKTKKQKKKRRKPREKHRAEGWSLLLLF